MNKRTLCYALLVMCLMITGSISAQNRQGYDQVSTLIDSAKVLEADVFAPNTWDKALKAYDKARQALMGGKKQKSVDKEVGKAREFTENSIKAAEVAKLSLEQYLPQRTKALDARAPILVPELYLKAREQFVKAAGKVESGDVKGGLKEAEKATPLYDVAELEAIRIDILGGASRLIEKAVADDATKYALSTLDKARSALTRADAIIINDRYNRTEAETEATLAEYEARHASNIALSVRSLSRNDQAWEKLMLVYEIQMNRIGDEVGLGQLPFDNGPLAAADALISYIRSLQADTRETTTRSADFSSNMTDKLQEILAGLGENVDSNDPLELADLIGIYVDNVTTEIEILKNEMQTTRVQYAALTEEHESMAGELSTRLEREEKFKKAKMSLNPSEGEVLFNSSNDIVLRLSGLSFDVGKSDIKDDHVSLLEKVKEVLTMFPDAHLVIEGHTDASGEPAANVLLSEKRAFAVMQYLRQSLLIPADRIRSIGYGADRPIASNQNKDGRSKNRRIDIIIMQ